MCPYNASTKCYKLPYFLSRVLTLPRLYRKSRMQMSRPVIRTHLLPRSRRPRHGNNELVTFHQRNQSLDLAAYPRSPIPQPTLPRKSNPNRRRCHRHQSPPSPTILQMFRPLPPPPPLWMTPPQLVPPPLAPQIQQEAQIPPPPHNPRWRTPT